MHGAVLLAAWCKELGQEPQGATRCLLLGGVRCWSGARGKGSTVVRRCCMPYISLGVCYIPTSALVIAAVSQDKG